jgi:hypothetical protein
LIVAAMVGAAILTGRPALAQPGDLREVRPNQDAYAEDRPIAEPPADRAVGVVLSLGSIILNAVFTPVKMAVGIAGAEIGGIAGAMAGGDEEAAAGVWNVTTDGSYVITPARLDGRDDFPMGGDVR